jgi:undecaprenyl-diphosphatase
MAAALAAYTTLAVARERAAAPLAFDRRVQWWVRRHQPGAFADLCAALTGQRATLAAGVLAATAVAARRGADAALPVLAAVPGSNALHAALKYSRRHRRPLRARITGKRTPSFPSGHAARGAALAGVLAHLAARDGRGAAAVLAAGGTVALVGAAQRVRVERHWASDVLGGWALGAAVAAGCAMWYDYVRDSTRGRESVKALPSPSRLSAVTSPPMPRARSRAMASPRPNPPARRVSD